MEELIFARWFFFVFKGDAATLQYTANLDCDLNLIGEEFSRKPYALAVQEGSPLRDQLSGVYVHKTVRRA